MNPHHTAEPLALVARFEAAVKRLAEAHEKNARGEETSFNRHGVDDLTRALDALRTEVVAALRGVPIRPGGGVQPGHWQRHAPTLAQARLHSAHGGAWLYRYQRVMAASEERELRLAKAGVTRQLGGGERLYVSDAGYNPQAGQPCTAPEEAWCAVTFDADGAPHSVSYPA